jgi:hypothetical protein
MSGSDRSASAVACSTPHLPATGPTGRVYWSRLDIALCSSVTTSHRTFSHRYPRWWRQHMRPLNYVWPAPCLQMTSDIRRL